MKVASFLFLSFAFSAIGHADIGDVHGRDLKLPGVSWAGHIGIEDESGYIYEMLKDSKITSEFGVESELGRNTAQSFKRASPYWGARYFSGLHTPKEIVRLKEYILPNANIAYRIGVDYTVSMGTREPKGQIFENGEKKVITKGLYRCDTFVAKMYETGKVDLGILNFLPRNVFNSFSDKRKFTPLASNTEGPVNRGTSLSEQIQEISKLHQSHDIESRVNTAIRYFESDSSKLAKKESLFVLLSSFASSNRKLQEGIKESVRKAFAEGAYTDMIASSDLATIFTVEEIAAIFEKHGNSLNHRSKLSLANTYLNSAILNEKKIALDGIGGVIEANISPMEIERRKLVIGAIWHQLTGNLDFGDSFIEELRELALSNIASSEDAKYLTRVFSAK